LPRAGNWLTSDLGQRRPLRLPSQNQKRLEPVCELAARTIATAGVRIEFMSYFVPFPGRSTRIATTSAGVVLGSAGTANDAGCPNGLGRTSTKFFFGFFVHDVAGQQRPSHSSFFHFLWQEAPCFQHRPNLWISSFRTSTEARFHRQPNNASSG